MQLKEAHNSSKNPNFSALTFHMICGVHFSVTLIYFHISFFYFYYLLPLASRLHPPLYSFPSHRCSCSPIGQSLPCSSSGGACAPAQIAAGGAKLKLGTVLLDLAARDWRSFSLSHACTYKNQDRWLHLYSFLLLLYLACLMGIGPLIRLLLRR